MDSLLSYSKKSFLNWLYIEAHDKDGNLILVAKEIRYYRLDMGDRKKFLKTMRRLESGEVLAVKVPKYQIVLLPKKRKDLSLSDDKILDILKDMAKNYDKVMGISFIMNMNPWLDISDEEFKIKLKEGRVARDYRFLIPIAIAVVVFLIIKGWFIGGFGILMLIAFAGDMFARR